ncbi:MAG: TetR family transcriptional regulator [Acidobacteria bacterium]|nr:TetR family transcriptional regulator [Acidobacteriota bacterium]
MPAPKKSREDVVELIGDVFRRHGYDGSSLAMISEATGLGRASLYHYFPEGKEQMGREVFAWIATHVQRDLLDPLIGDGAPADRLQAWTQGIHRFYEGGSKNCLLGAMVLSGGGDRYGQEIAGTLRELIRALIRVLRDAGVPATQARRRAGSAVVVVQGALVTARGLDDKKIFRQALEDLPDLLLRPTG